MPQPLPSQLMELPPEIFSIIIKKLDNQSLCQLSLACAMTASHTRQLRKSRLQQQFSFEFPLEYSKRNPDIDIASQLESARKKAYSALSNEEKSVFMAVRKGEQPSLENAKQLAFTKDGLGYSLISFIKNKKLLSQLHYQLIQQFTMQNTKPYTLLHLAIWCNQTVHQQITGRQVLNKVNQGITPIMLAAKLGRLQQLEALIDRGVSLEPVNSNTPSPLVIASERGYIDIIMSLIDNNAKLQAEPGIDSPLICAVRHNQLEVTKLLLGKGANPNHKGMNENTALHAAALNGNSGMIKLLVETGAKPSTNSEGLCPLAIAAKEKFVEATQCLLAENIPFLTEHAKKQITQFINVVAKAGPTQPKKESVITILSGCKQSIFPSNKKKQKLLTYLKKDEKIPPNFCSKQNHNTLWALTKIAKQVQQQPQQSANSGIKPSSE